MTLQNEAHVPVVTPVPEPDAVPVLERRNKRIQWSAAIPPLIVLVVLVGGAEILVGTGVVNDLIIPTPSSVVASLWSLFDTGLVWPHLWETLTEALLGFLVGSALAIAFAVGSSFWVTFRRSVAPYLVTFQVVPNVALAPIFITWFGFGLMPKVVMAATIVFFPVFVSTLTGLLTKDSDTLELMQSMRASKRQIFRELTLPTALPMMFSGLKTSVPLALTGALVAELVATSLGLGLLIDRFTFQLAMDQAFAVIVVLAVLGIGLFAIMGAIERQVVFWTHDERLYRRSRRAAAKQRKSS
jgi:NitT/TauT family transport system permease protein